MSGRKKRYQKDTVPMRVPIGNNEIKQERFLIKLK